MRAEYMGQRAGPQGRVLAVAGIVLAGALIVQVCIVTRLGLPFGSRADIVLVVLAAVALMEGPVAGALLGFGVGLFGDLMSSHVLGQGAVVLCLVGYCVGLLEGTPGRSARVPLVVVGLACALGTLGHAACAALLGPAPLSGGQVLARAVGAGLYGMLAAPFVVPLVRGGLRLLGDRP